MCVKFALNINLLIFIMSGVHIVDYPLKCAFAGTASRCTFQWISEQSVKKEPCISFSNIRLNLH